MNAKREKHPTQCDRLLKYLLAHRKITPLESWSKLGIYRLSARVYELRQMGYGITKTTANVVNAFGEKCSVGLYELTSVPEGVTTE